MWVSNWEGLSAVSSGSSVQSFVGRWDPFGIESSGGHRVLLIIDLLSSEYIPRLLSEGLLEVGVSMNNWSVSLIAWDNAVFTLNGIESVVHIII